MTSFLTTFLSCLIGACPAAQPVDAPAADAAALAELPPTLERPLTHVFDGKSLTGNYLASLFAQDHHDWKNADLFLERVLSASPNDEQMLKRAMILAMGSGQYDRAATYAARVSSINADDTLVHLFLAVDHFKKKEYALASQSLEHMEQGGLTQFIWPLMESWAKAGEGINNTQELSENSIHIYHAILIADFLGEHEHIEELLAQARSHDLTLQDMERIADIYAHIGKKEEAQKLYKAIIGEWPENKHAAQKLNDLEAGKDVKIFETVNAAEHGVAEAMYDMARLLYAEYSDESARLFAHMALYLNPAQNEVKLLLADIMARNKQYDQAITFYRAISKDDPQYMEARRSAADILEDEGHIEDALTELNTMVTEFGDVESLIQIGDVYRRNEEFGQAIASYNRVQDMLGGDIPREYWHVLYARGMSYEQAGQWDKAESDLQAALNFQPDHPYVMNYLGYAWADQGVNLKRSLEMIRKAAELRPYDGYIIDSLGWVLYRMDEFEQAVPALEKAVQLLPYDPVINDHLGDAYWRVGRKMEARFQWERSRNHSEDSALTENLNHKLEAGLETIKVIEHANSSETDMDILKP